MNPKAKIPYPFSTKNNPIFSIHQNITQKSKTHLCTGDNVVEIRYCNMNVKNT